MIGAAADSHHTMRADHARRWLTNGQRQVHLPALGLPFASTYECRTAVGSAALKTKRTQGALWISTI